MLPTMDYCVQFFSLFDDTEISHVSKLLIIPASFLYNPFLEQSFFLYISTYYIHFICFQVQVIERNYDPADETTVRFLIVIVWKGLLTFFRAT